MLGVRDGQGGGLAPRGPTRRRQRVSCALTLKDLGLFFLCPGSLKSFKYHDQKEQGTSATFFFWPTVGPQRIGLWIQEGG